MLQISVLLCLLLPQLAWSWYGNIKKPFISFLPCLWSLDFLFCMYGFIVPTHKVCVLADKTELVSGVCLWCCFIYFCPSICHVDDVPIAIWAYDDTCEVLLINLTIFLCICYFAFFLLTICQCQWCWKHISFAPIWLSLPVRLPAVLEDGSPRHRAPQHLAELRLSPPLGRLGRGGSTLSSTGSLENTQ
jgi:hypothetical protein